MPPRPGWYVAYYGSPVENVEASLILSAGPFKTIKEAAAKIEDLDEFAVHIGLGGK